MKLRSPRHPIAATAMLLALSISVVSFPLLLDRNVTLASRVAQAEGELAPGVDVGNLARYIATVIQGLAVQAAGGATRKSLYKVVEVAMRAWPGGG